jgi:hypothetical protein
VTPFLKVVHNKHHNFCCRLHPREYLITSLRSLLYMKMVLRQKLSSAPHSKQHRPQRLAFELN